MRLAVIDAEGSPLQGSISAELQPDTRRPYLDLAVRDLVKQRSTVTSLESLASSADTDTEHAFKRTANTVAPDEKPRPSKEPRNNFLGMFPSAGDSSKIFKRTRLSEDIDD